MARTPTGTVAPIPPSGEGMAVRKAGMQDISQLLRLINGYAGQGIMLPRTEFEISENIRDFTVVAVGERIVGCAALHFYTPTSGEIRSLAVDSAARGAGAGRKMMEALELEARNFGLESVFAFTYIPDFFARLGYVTIDRGELPLKAWKDCLRCPKFQCCDENAVIKYLETDGMGVVDTHISGSTRLPSSDPSHALPQLSVYKSH